MKALNWIGWISSGLGVVFMLLGFISALFGRFNRGTESINFFHVANSFFLITISLFIFLYRVNVKNSN
jgi:hypothetical protein